MGQFKPMVKMMTTEPTVELKLKKGGHVSSKSKGKSEDGFKPMHKADGGMMGALAGAPSLVGRPVSASPVATPMKPSMAMRRKAMKSKRKPSTAPVPVSGLTPAAPAGLPAGLPAMKKGGKMKHEDEAEDRAMIKKAMAGKKFATGGVAMGQSGYAKGGGVEGNVSGTPAGVTNTKTGGVKDGNGGGYKKGGAAKKFADGGAVQDDGRAVKMPQGKKKPSAPVAITELSGTFKKGGKVGKFASGGRSSDDEYMEQLVRDKKMDRATQKGYENAPKASRELESAMNPLSMAKEAFDKVKDYFSGSKLPAGSVTKTKESVTVAKKRGGKC